MTGHKIEKLGESGQYISEFHLSGDFDAADRFYKFIDLMESFIVVKSFNFCYLLIQIYKYNSMFLLLNPFLDLQNSIFNKIKKSEKS